MVEDMRQIDIIVQHLKERDGVVAIPTSSLNVKGKCVQEKMDKYLATRDFLQSGTYAAAKKSALHFMYETVGTTKDDYESTKGADRSFLSLGTYLHECFLEPSKFKKVVVEPDLDKSKKVDVNDLMIFWMDAFKEEHKDHPVDQYAESTLLKICQEVLERYEKASHVEDNINAMRDVIREIKRQSNLRPVTHNEKVVIDAVYFNAKRYAGGVIFELLKGAKREISMYGIDPESGIPTKIRPDALQFEENIGLNANISFKSIAGKMKPNIIEQYKYDGMRLDYFLKDAVYNHMASVITDRHFDCTIAIILESTPPFGVALLIYPEELRQRGHMDFELARHTVTECQDKNFYPGYEIYAEEGDMGFIELDMPPWYINREFEETNIQEYPDAEPVDYSDSEDLPPDYNES